jgi:hypothetical protein
MDMVRHDLIQLAKERGLGTYNKLNKPSLVKILSDYDAMSVMEEEERGDRGEGSEEEKRDTKTIATLDWNGIVIQSRESDKYINATQLCKAGGKKFKHWNENDRTKHFLEALSASIGITIGNLAYIGNGLVKLGQSSDIHNRMIKHISCESEFDQFRFISLFEISGEKMEKKLKKLLNRFNFKFSKQVEVFKPQGTLEEFNRIVQNYLKDNDLRLRLRERDAEIAILKEKRLRSLEKYISRDTE